MRADSGAGKAPGTLTLLARDARILACGLVPTVA
jgi:hypothetical protein